MSRFVVMSCLLVACACTKSSSDSGSKPVTTGNTGNGGEKRLNVPGGEGATVGGANETKGGNDARYRLAPDEGKLLVEPPQDPKANAEATVKITVTAGDAFKVNTEFPTKLTLENTQGVTIAKAELKAGGHDKAKGDAEQFDEKALVFAVKLTPTAAGSFTVNGSFKFAVCDKSGTTCLAKKEPIAIQLAAK
jgi:hypothetical protein